MRILLIVFFCFTIKASFSQNDTAFYTLKVRLVKEEPHPPDCGVFAWALTQKFEVIVGNFYSIKTGDFILLNQPCPEFLSPGFFKKDQLYAVKVSRKSGSSFEYKTNWNYESEVLPVFWIREIK